MQDITFISPKSQVSLLPAGKTTNGHGPTGLDNSGFIGQGESEEIYTYPAHHNDANDDDWVFEDSRKATISTGGFTWASVKDIARESCTLTAWRMRLPITYWLPKYSLRDFRGDMVAGLTVGLTVVPQGLAYAAIAQVPLEYGLYSAFMGCFMYTLFGTAKDITLGPTAVLSLMTAGSFPKDATPDDKAHFAVILSFFVGITQVLLGIFNLGFLVNFISAPVISGFTTASAFIILYGQLKTLLGLKFDTNDYGTGDNVIGYSIGYVKTIRAIK